MPDNQTMKQALRQGAECPPLDLLSTHLNAVAGTAERRAAELHLDQCPHCKTEIDLLHQFESGAIQPEEENDVRWITSRLAAKPVLPVSPESRAWWARLRWLSPKALTGLATVAAMAIVAIGISQWTGRDTRQRPVPEFGGEVLRSRSIEVIDAPGSFQWKPVSGASQYELTVRGVDGSVIFHNLFTVQALPYPPEVVRNITTGKLLLWEVVAKDRTGREIARSGVQRLNSKTLPAQ